jgi:hypothetical protein
MGYHTSRSAEHWSYDTAALAIVNWEEKRIERDLTYVSPPAVRAHSGHMLFSCGCLQGRELLVPTATEVLRIDLDAWKIRQAISLPHFNDLHHVLKVGEHVYVCNTGLQAVQVLTAEGRLLETVGTDDKATWSVYDPDQDYRGLKTSPHAVHPNHLFLVGDEVWVTRAVQKDAVALRDHERRLPIDVGTPHDGVVRNGVVYFTTTNGHLVGVDPRTQRRVREVDLNALDRRGQLLGWCRGLCFLDDDRVVVGFGQFRRTKYKQFAHWILNDGKVALPSRLALYDLKKSALVDELPFVGPHEGLALYSIFPWPG